MLVLVTGGAGFIGTHVARRLLQNGDSVRILDNFSPQIHGDSNTLPADLAPHVQLLRGDVRNAAAWAPALDGVSAVVHLAAETGTGQSMYDVAHYAEVNVQGTAHLYDHLVNGKCPSVEHVIVASSRAVCGEGQYACLEHGRVFPPSRLPADLDAGVFDPRCPYCARICVPELTDETCPRVPTSFYGLTKATQEQMAIMFGESLGMPTYALRFQNVYGPGQSLKNPYTGILAIFSSLARGNQPIRIFEDGQESRDFVHVADVADAVCACLHTAASGSHVLNIGSGQRTSVLEVARAITDFFRSRSELRVTGEYRIGDIRHNCANTQAAASLIGFHAKRSFDAGMADFLAWASSQPVPSIAYEASLDEMEAKGMLHGR